MTRPTAAHAPHDPRTAMRRVLVALAPGVLVLIGWYGWGPLIQLGLAIVTFCGCDALARRLRKQRMPADRSLGGRPLLGDGSGLVSALLLGVALPGYGPWWVVVTAAAFASLAGKAPFGPARNPFNPAMLGYAFALMAFPAQMAQWPAPGASPDLLDSLQQVFRIGDGLPDGWSQATLLDILKHNQRLTIEELFERVPAFGAFGARGLEWVNLAFLAGGLLLLRQKVIGWQGPLGMLGALFVASLLCWNGSGSDSNGSPLVHLSSGGTLLAAFFIVTEPVTGASTPRGRLLFGIGVGLLTYAIRTWGSYPDGIAFAVLLMNLCVTRLDHLGRAR